MDDNYTKVDGDESTEEQISHLMTPSNIGTNFGPGWNSETDSDFSSRKNSVWSGTLVIEETQGEFEIMLPVEHAYESGDDIEESTDKFAKVPTPDYSNLDKIISDKIQNTIREENVLNEEELLRKSTKIPKIAREESQQTFQNTFLTHSGISNNTAIDGYLKEKYSIEKQTINDLEEFKEKSLEYHKSNVEVRRQWRITESIGIAFLGLSSLIMSIGIQVLEINLGGLILNATVSLLLILIGSLLIYSGYQGLENLGENDE